MSSNQSPGGKLVPMRSRGVAAMASIVCLAIAACAHAPAGGEGATARSDEQLFIAAIKEAAVPTEVYTKLVSITPSDPRITWRDETKQRVLVVTWKSEDDSRKYFPVAGGVGKTSENEAYVLWVTAAPQLKQFCQALGLTGAQLSRRLKQYLGLNPSRSYERFIEIWADPNEMFRPCPDPEPTDTQCNLSWSGSPQAPRIADYRAFFRGLYESSYSTKGAPWTRLGYTYDWTPGANKVGASEFVLAPSSSYEVKASYTTDEYCRP